MDTVYITKQRTIFLEKREDFLYVLQRTIKKIY